ncbi:hypothetical protein [Streptomyces werraensis]|uniref:hypothetical protein n=1 Tax=Streptomyces werraensis TaxID=68284 RepID=UPI0036ACCCB1
MSRREDILTALRHAYGEGAGLDGLTAEQLLDAYRAEVLAEAKTETVAWLVKKAREYRATGSSQHARQAEAVEFLASKVDRGAVRAFLGTAHYRDALDAHRAQVLTELTDEAERRLSAGRSNTVTKATVLRFLRLEASCARAGIRKDTDG